MKNKILVFGGTTEGRKLADILRDNQVPHAVSVATEYGEEIEKEAGETFLFVGRKTADEMAAIMNKQDFSVVVDATHPFAVAASAEIRKACDKSGAMYLRLARDTAAGEQEEYQIRYVTDISKAVDELNFIKGNILLMTGSKDLKQIVSGIDDASRLYARVLPSSESLDKCAEAGIAGKHIIAMQGPFSAEMNEALIREIDARAILTKESGSVGGYQEKLQAAKSCNITAVVIKNPDHISKEQKSYDLAGMVQKLSEVLDVQLLGRHIILAGIGPGDDRYHTRELTRALGSADIIFGAESVVKRLDRTGKKIVMSYKPEEICDYLEKNPEYLRPVVVFSGDISLCSGCHNAAEYMTSRGYKVEKIAGISSVSLFAEKINVKLEEVTLLSSHGRKCNVRGYVEKNEKIILLPSDVAEAFDICKSISEMHDGLEGFDIIFGYELGTDQEEVRHIGECHEIDVSLTGKCILYIENHNAAGSPIIRGLSDDEFIRETVPMSKEEIRGLIIRKLSLARNSTFFDIGAGTGSVSIEAALFDPSVRVYSIDKNPEAVELLHRNKSYYCADNMEIIEGTAPAALKGLPVPTHAFIGGSEGNLESIIRTLYEMNPQVRIVVTSVTLETLSQVTDIVKETDGARADIIHVNVSRFVKRGRFTMADAINPVFIMTIVKDIKE